MKHQTRWREYISHYRMQVYEGYFWKSNLKDKHFHCPVSSKFTGLSFIFASNFTAFEWELLLILMHSFHLELLFSLSFHVCILKMDVLFQSVYSLPAKHFPLIQCWLQAYNSTNWSEASYKALERVCEHVCKQAWKWVSMKAHPRTQLWSLLCGLFTDLAFFHRALWNLHRTVKTV